MFEKADFGCLYQTGASVVACAEVSKQLPQLICIIKRLLDFSNRVMVATSFAPHRQQFFSLRRGYHGDHVSSLVAVQIHKWPAKCSKGGPLFQRLLRRAKIFNWSRVGHVLSY